MGIAFQYLSRMLDHQLLSGDTRVLDVGCSNLYGATAPGILSLLSRMEVETPAADVVDDLAARSAAGTAFVVELFDLIGIEYQAIDFVPAAKTMKLDLNRDRLPGEFKGAFDLVLNFGTTEHVLDQTRCFELIHDACKPGGAIYHQVPAGGYFGHGYFAYTGRFFFDLAVYNKYRIVAAWYDQGAESQLSKIFEDYARHFPALLDAPTPKQDAFPDTGINVIYRKPYDRPFAYPMELSTAHTGTGEAFLIKVAHYLRRAAFWQKLRRALSH